MILSPKQTAYQALFPLVRAHLWPPDGLPPAGWDERREGSVLKRLLQHRTVSQLEVAIIGLAQLRDTGQVDWLHKGAKVTSRALYNTRSGVSQMFELATAEYWRALKLRPKRRKTDSVGDILMHSLRQSSDYKAYLRSPEWRRRRERAIMAAGLRCQRCGRAGAALEVHHRNYANLGHEEDADLEVLCPECHPIADRERQGVA